MAICDNNELISLDLSGCEKLKLLYCNNNQIRELDVSQYNGEITAYCDNEVNVTGEYDNNLE